MSVALVSEDFISSRSRIRLLKRNLTRRRRFSAVLQHSYSLRKSVAITQPTGRDSAAERPASAREHDSSERVSMRDTHRGDAAKY